MPTVFSTTDESTQPGYFRIGSVELQIPPSDISTNRVNNDDQCPTLRGSTPMFIKSGQARWDVTIHWKSLRTVDTDGTFDYSQWQDLRRIVATFRASPFVEVENDFLRQHFTNVQENYKSSRMAFALKQLRIDTDPNTTDVLDVTLTMSLFNYSPFSTDFAYVGGDGTTPVDAIDSPTYNAFINHWMSVNMDSNPRSKGEPELMPWDQQDEGTLTFKWRTYLYVPFNPSAQSLQPSEKASAGYSPVTPPLSVSKRVSSKKLSNDIQEIINTKAAKYKLDPAIVTAQCIYESGGKADAVSRTGAIGLLQLIPSTARALGVSDPYDPQQNIEGGCKYLAEQLRRFGNYSHALGAYNAGAAYIYAYRDGKTQSKGRINPQKVKTADGLPPPGTPHGENVPLYVKTILSNASRLQDISTPPPKGISAPPSTPLDVTLTDKQDPSLVQQLNDAATKLPDGNWLQDHYTSQGAFFYEEEEIFLASADSPLDGQFNIFPQQLSIVFVNNLPLIPLAGMQYPTYQHVGPTDTIISIGMNSVGTENNILNEPSHEGIQALATMLSTLEDQFHNLRTNFRAVSSVHRMQAVFMENQILNMLGIRGTLLRGMNTETVPDAANLAQVNLMASQYENIFEESSPFRVNGLPKAYKGTLQGLLKGGDLAKATPEEQKAYFVVKQFSDAWIAHDENYLAGELLRMMHEPIDYLDNVNTPPTDIWFTDRDQLFNALDLAEGEGSTLDPNNELGPRQSGTFVGLQARRKKLQGFTIQLSYADYFVFSHLPLKFDATVAVIKAKMDTKFANQKADIIETMYQRLFDYELVTNPLFSRQTTALVNSPGFKKRFAGAVTVDGPALLNPGHFCYKDLGLTDYRQDPADYFINHNEILRQGITSRLTSIMGTANDASNQVNATTTTQAGKALADGGQTGFVFSGDGQQLPGNADALSRMINVPAYTLNSAFPTYKLMLIEEDNTGPFFAFDNFYSYASVMDIEVIKYMDKPDTAILQITNLAHVLQHRLFDDTAAGKLEAQDDRFNIDPSGGIVQGGPNVDTNEAGTGGNPNSIITASKSASGTPYQNKNMSEGRGGTAKRIPLKYFALQTGAKIQVRLGYANNPDNLYPVFTGQVTSIEGDDILTITCQSFQLELMNVPGTTVIKDSRLGFNVVTGGSAMGGWSLSNAGDTFSVLEKLLTSECARHFGRWQIGGQVDKLLKGFTWSELGGKALSGASNQTIQKVAALLQTGYDRSHENILINSNINFDATKSDKDPANAGRRQFDENTDWIQSYLRLGTASYSVPKQSELSIWDLMKDISRRYPHYNLMVRDYGFPYGADATLVYAHPLDWYYRRPPLYGDAEKEKANNVTQGQRFQQWWGSIGKPKWTEIWNHAFDSNSVAGVPIRQALSQAQADMTNLAGTGPEGFVSSIQQAHGILSGTTDLPSSDEAFATFFTALQVVQNIFAKVANSGNLTQGFYKNLDANFQSLLREWEQYLIQSDPAANSSRMKPVRQYHLVDHNHIVHNGITVNDQIYNAVKIQDEAPLKFNQNILGHNTRTLIVTDLINNPDLNTNSIEMKRVYAQSFLREEVGKMYRGELVLRGVPEIEPYDIILLQDPSTGTIGPVEVETVIHSFNMESGYVTIVKPRLHVIANESVSMNIIRTLGFAWANAYAELHNLGHVFSPVGKDSTISGTVGGAGLAVAGGLAIAALGVWVPPIGITIAALSLLSGYGLITWLNEQQNLNFFKIQPLSKFGRPWIGGLQGFAISDFAYSVLHKLEHFDAEEIRPTIESWNEFMHYQVDYPPGE